MPRSSDSVAALAAALDKAQAELVNPEKSLTATIREFYAGGLQSASERSDGGAVGRQDGRRVRDVQRRVRHSAIPWVAATLDGIVEGTEAVFEAKFMLPWSFSEEAAAEKHMAQLQHNMWVVNAREAVLSIITGGGKWVEMDHSGRQPLPALVDHC